MAEAEGKEQTKRSLPEHHPDVAGADPDAPCPFLTPTDFSGYVSNAARASRANVDTTI